MGSQQGCRRLNNANYQLDLTDIYETLQSINTEYMFFSNAHGELFRLDNVLGHKANFNEFKRTKVIQTVFSDTLLVS